MERLKCTVQYDGTDFCGYQVQPNKRTVQGAIQEALQKMHKGEFIKVSASGRTDAGVHAVGQVIHFDTPLTIPTDNWKRALNTLLPDDIDILSVEKVLDDFHARFSVKEKEYRYIVLQQDIPDVFQRNHVYYVKEALDVDRMKRACPYFLGTHDFSSFCAANTSVVDKVRTIYSFDVSQEGHDIIFRIVGEGFLYQMVRIIVGTVLEIGKGNAEPDCIADIIKQRDRTKAFKTAPARGLYLWHVDYS